MSTIAIDTTDDPAATPAAANRHPDADLATLDAMGDEVEGQSGMLDPYGSVTSAGTVEPGASSPNTGTPSGQRRTVGLKSA